MCTAYVIEYSLVIAIGGFQKCFRQLLFVFPSTPSHTHTHIYYVFLLMCTSVYIVSEDALRLLRYFLSLNLYSDIFVTIICFNFSSVYPKSSICYIQGCNILKMTQHANIITHPFLLACYYKE